MSIVDLKKSTIQIFFHFRIDFEKKNSIQYRSFQNDYLAIDAFRIY